MPKVDAAPEPNEIHIVTFFFFNHIEKKKPNIQTEFFGINRFLISVKEQGNIKEAGERVKGNHVHY